MVSEKNEAEIKEVLNYLSELVIKYENEGQESDTKRIIEYMTEIGKAAAMSKLELVVVIALQLFSLVAREACRLQMANVLVSIALAFGEIGKVAAGQKMEATAKIAASCLGEMGNIPAFTRTKKETIAIIFALGEIGKSVTLQSLGNVANSTVALLGETGQIAAIQNFEDAALNAELLLQEIGTGAIERDLKETADTIVGSLQDIVGKTTDRQGLERALLQAAYSLETIIFNADDRCLMSASIVAEVALLNFDRLEVKELEEKLNKNFRGKKRSPGAGL